MEPWLEALKALGNPAWQPDWDSWTPTLVAQVWVNRQGRGKAEYADPDWPTPVLLDEKEAELATHLGGTAADLARAWAERHGSSQEAARREVAELLRQLGRKYVLS